jgi:hypothetical protein
VFITIFIIIINSDDDRVEDFTENLVTPREDNFVDEDNLDDPDIEIGIVMHVYMHMKAFSSTTSEIRKIYN